MNLQSGRTDLDFEVPSKAAKAVSHFCLRDGAVKQLSFMHLLFVKVVPKLDTGMLKNVPSKNVPSVSVHQHSFYKKNLQLSSCLPKESLET